MMYNTLNVSLPSWIMVLLMLLGGAKPVELLHETKSQYSAGKLQFICTFALFKDEDEKGKLNLEIYYKIR